MYKVFYKLKWLPIPYRLAIETNNLQEAVLKMAEIAYLPYGLYRIQLFIDYVLFYTEEDIEAFPNSWLEDRYKEFDWKDDFRGIFDVEAPNTPKKEVIYIDDEYLDDTEEYRLLPLRTAEGWV